MGTVIKLADSIGATPFGIFDPFGAVNKTTGTIALWDADFRAAGEGVPADGSTAINLVREQAVAITGLTEAECDLQVVNSGNGFIAVEETAKRGIHVASTLAGGQNAASSFSLCPSAALANWLMANIDAGQDYALLFSLWLRPTRAGTQSSPGLRQPYSFMGPNSGSYSHIMQYQGFPSPGENIGASGAAGRIRTGPPALDTPGGARRLPQRVGWERSPPILTSRTSAISRMSAHSGRSSPSIRTRRKAPSSTGCRWMSSIWRRVTPISKPARRHCSMRRLRRRAKHSAAVAGSRGTASPIRRC